jgi:hypothetical protein
LLISRQSIHILQVPFFLDISNNDTTQELILSWMYHFEINSSTYLWSSFTSQDCFYRLVD